MSKLKKLKKEAAEREKAAKIKKNKKLFEQGLNRPKPSKKRSSKEADSGFLDELKRLKKEKEERDKKEETAKLTPAERLAKIREEMERKRLESISSGEKKDLDKVDMKLLFSQKW